MGISTSDAVIKHDRSRSSWYPMHHGWYQRLQLLHRRANDDCSASPPPSLDPSSFSPQIAQAEDGNDSSLTGSTAPPPVSCVILFVSAVRPKRKLPRIK